MTIPIVTKHAVERIVERFPAIAKDYPALSKPFNEDGSLKYKTISGIRNLLLNSNENNSFLNNSMFMMKMYEKHGYDTDFKFQVNPSYGMVFVLIKEANKKRFIMVTVLKDANFLANNIKYNDKKSKEDKNFNAMVGQYDHYMRKTKSKRLVTNIVTNVPDTLKKTDMRLFDSVDKFNPILYKELKGEDYDETDLIISKGITNGLTRTLPRGRDLGHSNHVLYVYEYDGYFNLILKDTHSHKMWRVHKKKINSTGYSELDTDVENSLLGKIKTSGDFSVLLEEKFYCGVAKYVSSSDDSDELSIYKINGIFNLEDDRLCGDIIDHLWNTAYHKFNILPSIWYAKCFDHHLMTKSEYVFDHKSKKIWSQSEIIKL